MDTSTGVPQFLANLPRTVLDSEPDEVRVFVHTHLLDTHLENAARLIRSIFPIGSTLTTTIEAEEDSDAKWLVVTVMIRGSADEALKYYDIFVEKWLAVAPPCIGNYLRVTVSLS